MVAGLRHDDAGIAKADERDEQSDAGRHRRVEFMRDGGDDELPDARPAVSRKKATPEMKTAPNAACQGTPMPFTTEYVKYALSPMPGASAMG